ncbi:hypothetical protein FRZ61_26850 [Hypericibacter adhaerens]|uniref:SCP2 domain-containing protein n=1 Tax=Hypericibacter adhaerens TaxID=2602016 RepID=A0A5J6N171_9PROT|nr:hypothetical protein [Hypericibacter adhaerens]QEX22753.1 hypothetical protein FRZ61_26850 [Hypericibacter adhaerens]
MALLKIDDFRAAAERDLEFVRETRYLNGAVKVGIADDVHVLHFKEGKLTQITGDSVPDDQCKIVVRGTRDHWTNMLAAKPKPFYQCLQSTAVKHGLKLSVTNETFAYLPALNRMMSLMRDVANRGAR